MNSSPSRTGNSQQGRTGCLTGRVDDRVHGTGGLAHGIHGRACRDRGWKGEDEEARSQEHGSGGDSLRNKHVENLGLFERFGDSDGGEQGLLGWGNEEWP